jgi:hypothetical protein
MRSPGQAHTHTDARPDRAKWVTVRDVVDQVCFDRGVEPGAIDAVLQGLEVEGVGWQLAAPGFLLYSPAAAADLRAAEVILYTAFASSVAAISG